MVETTNTSGATQVEEPVVTTVEPAPPGGPPSSEPTKRPKRPLAVRLFSVSVWQVLQIIVLSTLVGLFLLSLDFSPDRQGLNAGQALWEVVHAFFSAVWWIVKTFWKPLLAGAAIVLPLWVLWRLLTLPFRK